MSAQTVYDSVGSKQQLVAQLNDLIDAEAGIGAIVARRPAVRGPAQGRGDLGARRALDPRALRRHHPRARHRRRGGAGARRRAGGGPAAPRRRRHHRRRPAHSELGAPLGPTAVETLAAVSDVRFALVLQESYGWSLDQLERWMTDRRTRAPALACWRRLARAALGELRRAGARRVGGLVVRLLLRVALGRHALAVELDLAGDRRPPTSRAPRPSGGRPARRRTSPRSKVSIEIRVRRASTSSRCWAPSWAAAYQTSTRR